MRRPVRPIVRPKTHRVERLWPGETCVILASGPSMTREDAEFVRGRARVIAINRTIELAPWADVWYAADAKVWKWTRRGDGTYAAIRPIFESFSGLKFSLTSESASWGGATVIGKGASDGLSLDPGKLCLGGNSGYQAINLAVLLGASRIVLLGYDMGVTSQGREYWHPDHPHNHRSPYQTFRQHFPSLVAPLKAAGVELVNCSRETRLTCFPRAELADVFPVERQEQVA